jgi:hypothetical protein
MEPNKQTIKDLIAKSSLGVKEQDELVSFFALASENELAPVAALFSENLSLVEMIYKNYKAKKEAIASGDKGAWSKIVQEEEQQLNSL